MHAPAVFEARFAWHRRGIYEGVHRKMLKQHVAFSEICLLVFVLSGLALKPGIAQQDDAGTDKVIYGNDDRIDVYQENNAERRAWADAVCALVEWSDLQDNQDGTYFLKTEAYRVAGKPPCSGEAFSTQPMGAYCSGFMAADDIIVTAGHCLTLDRLSDFAIVFGFDMLDANTPRYLFDWSQVYFAVEVLAYQYTPTLDFAVVRVDRSITAPGASPLPMRESGLVEIGTPVGVIGHPFGLPKKLAFSSDTQVRRIDAPYFFFANVDAFSGNSGSPVFNAATGMVEGILVRGNTDFNVGMSCFESRRLRNDEQYPEAITRSSAFANYVYDDGLIPGNDECSNATEILNDSFISGTTRNATGSSVSSCGVEDYKDVWFFFQVPRNDHYLISLCDGDFDTTLALYKGSCGALDEFDCDDDSCGSRSQICAELHAGETVYIRVAGKRGAVGNYILHIDSGADCSEPACGRTDSEDLAGILMFFMILIATIFFSFMK